MRLRLSQDVWVILVLLLFLVGISCFAGKRQSGSAVELMPKRTSYSARENGLKALYDTLHDLGYPVKRDLRPFTARPRDGVLFVTAPEQPVTDEEWASLQRWVADGNTLIVTPETYSTELWSPKGVKTEESTPACPSFLSPRVSSFRSPENTSVTDTEWKFGDTATQPQLGIPRSAKKKQPALVKKPTDTSKEAYPLVPLFSGKSGTTVAYTPYGNGAVINLCSAWCISNKGISAGDNIMLILNAISIGSQGGRPVVTFDEYHHGYGGRAGIISLIGTPARLGLLQLGMAFLLLIFAVARRQSRPIPLYEGARPRSEYLNSMTSLLRRAHAAGVVKAALERKFLDDVGRVLNLPPNSDAQTILTAASIRYPQKTEQLRQLLTIVQASPDEALDDATLLALTIRRNQFRKDLVKTK